jgi:chemotaxis protein MotB
MKYIPIHFKILPITAFVALFLITSCVPERKYVEMKNQYEDCSSKRTLCEKSMAEKDELIKANQEQLSAMITRLAALRLDSSECNMALEKTRKLYHDLQELQRKIIVNTREDQERTERHLMETAELLRQKEKAMAEKEENLRRSEHRIGDLEEDVKKREARVAELERILRSKDSTVQALKETVQKALFDFQKSGLTVDIRNGKVYVSLDEKLLFKSGSIVVDNAGKNALLELAKALRTQDDISVLVEGHTDNVPMKSNQIKDNWDLSVLRATSIARILVEDGKLSPTQVVASGRGETDPVATNETSEGRAKNRRTEIILTPKLNELLQILGN